MIDLSNLLLEGVNIVDIYICPRGAECSDDWACVGWSTPAKSLPNFGNGKGVSQHFLEYYHRELCYVYDTANDGQRVLQRKLLKTIQQRSLIAYAYQEDQLPAHKYPCVSEVTHKQEVHRTTYRINNRLSFIVDVEKHGEITWTFYYLRYQHAPNVDTKKVEEDMKYALRACKVLS